MNFIRSVIKFQSGMENREIRAEFEDYLVQNYEHYSTRESTNKHAYYVGIHWNELHNTFWLQYKDSQLTKHVFSESDLIKIVLDCEKFVFGM